MISLQELVARGRFLFASAPERQRVFELVDGKRNARDIAKKSKRHINNIRRDLKHLSDAGLIQAKQTRDGTPQLKDRLPVFEKVPLARTIPPRYFRGGVLKTATSQVSSSARRRAAARSPIRKPKPLAVPSETGVLDICRHGEDQLYEFKGVGTKPEKIVKEIAAMLHARQGGLILYGVDDDGTIQGTDLSRQKFDQPLQNCLRDKVAPAATVRLAAVKALGQEVLVILVPPWNRKDVYQFEGRVLLRKGTNAVWAKPEEVRRLHRGEYVL
ncbi:MAG: AlbA family DNA-binding domain-containing protein [Actinomycetota bacterium]